MLMFKLFELFGILSLVMAILLTVHYWGMYNELFHKIAAPSGLSVLYFCLGVFLQPGYDDLQKFS